MINCYLVSKNNIGTDLLKQWFKKFKPFSENIVRTPYVISKKVSNGVNIYELTITDDNLLSDITKLMINWNSTDENPIMMMDNTITPRLKLSPINLEFNKEFENLLLSRIHGSWINDKHENGWRFSFEYDEKSKTDPDLRPWPDMNKKPKTSILRHIVDSLRDSNLQIINKPK